MALRATRLAPFRAALSLRRPQASGFTPYHGGRPARRGGEEWRGCPEGSFQRPRPLGRGTGFTIPLVMGILNVTPDSFSDGGMFLDPGSAVRRGPELAEQGADLLDLGGESTRPGAVRVPAAEELRRGIPGLERRGGGGGRARP